MYSPYYGGARAFQLSVNAGFNVTFTGSIANDGIPHPTKRTLSITNSLLDNNYIFLGSCTFNDTGRSTDTLSNSQMQRYADGDNGLSTVGEDRLTLFGALWNYLMKTTDSDVTSLKNTYHIYPGYLYRYNSTAMGKFKVIYCDDMDAAQTALGGILYNYNDLYSNGKIDSVISDIGDFNYSLSIPSQPNKGILNGYATMTESYDLYKYWVSCLTVDTPITMADYTIKLAKDIKIGDTILTAHGPDKVVWTDLSLHKLSNKHFVYEFSDGRTLDIVRDHRVYSLKDRKYKKLSKWTIGETTITTDGKEISLVKCTEVDSLVQHCIIYTLGHNSQYANGILTGNRLANIKCN